MWNSAKDATIWVWHICPSQWPCWESPEINGKLGCFLGNFHHGWSSIKEIPHLEKTGGTLSPVYPLSLQIRLCRENIRAVYLWFLIFSFALAMSIIAVTVITAFIFFRLHLLSLRTKLARLILWQSQNILITNFTPCFCKTCNQPSHSSCKMHITKSVSLTPTEWITAGNIEITWTHIAHFRTCPCIRHD